MNPILIIQARIDELNGELKGLVKALQALKGGAGGQSMQHTNEHFQQLNKYKDQVLTIRSGIAELEYVKNIIKG